MKTNLVCLYMSYCFGLAWLLIQQLNNHNKLLESLNLSVGFADGHHLMYRMQNWVLDQWYITGLSIPGPRFDSGVAETDFWKKRYLHFSLSVS